MDGEWMEIGATNMVETEGGLHAVLKNNILHVFYPGLGIHWKTFDGKEWADRSANAPGTRILRILFWRVAPLCSFLLLPALLVLPAHLYFKQHKESLIEINGLDVELASLGRRFAAFSFDTALVYVPFLLVFIYLVVFRLDPIDAIFERPSGGTWLLLTVIFTALAGALAGPAYFVVLERKQGRTIGKRLMHIRVVRADGADLCFKRVLIRNLHRVWDLALYFIPAIVAVAATEKQQRLGDLAAGTVVVRE